MNYFQKVNEYLLELGYVVTHQKEADIIVIENELQGIKNLVLVVADPLLIVEQYICDISSPTADIYKQLMQKSRDIIHGAFVLDETGNKLLFRNTHELKNLDLNEIAATFNSLALLLGEYSNEILKLSKK